MSDFQIALPEKVSAVIHTLQDHGYEAYAVGGCVRDAMLKRTPEDWDIATSAMPEETKALFRRTIDTGIQHGTVTVLVGKEGFEVTTYRIDGKYEDNRHPSQVAFTRSLQEDLLRRDFTINAMAYNDSDGLVDIFGGTEDLGRGIIRCVGNAMERLSEDALRILRGVRFAAQLGFAVEKETQEAMGILAPTLQNISAERIQVELVKMMVSPIPDTLRLSYELGITREFLPEFDDMMETEQETPHHMYNVGEHTLHALMNIRPEKVLRLAMLLHDTGKPSMKTMDAEGVAHFKKHAVRSEEIARTVLRRLKFDNDTIRSVTKLVLYHDCRMPAEAKYVRRAINKIGVELFPLYLEVRRADILSQSEYCREEKMQSIADTERLYREIMEAGQCVELKTLAVTGKDLLDAGMRPGKAMGDTLNRLLQLVLEHPEWNTKEELLRRIFSETE